jgi:hypothetical protein
MGVGTVGTFGSELGVRSAGSGSAMEIVRSLRKSLLPGLAPRRAGA